MKHSWSILAVMCGAVLGLGNAWAGPATLPPPSAPPTSLPPIPKDMPLPSVRLPPLPRQGVVEPPKQEPAVAQVAAEEEPYQAQVLESMLDTEIQRLNQALSPNMQAVLLRTDNPQYKQYVSNGLLKMSAQEFAKHDHGLAGTVAATGRMNGTQTPVCYVLFDADRGEQLWDNFIIPIKKVSHPQSGAAWLMGHEVGHCLDQLERAQKINKRMSWTAEQALSLGILPQAVQNTYGKSFSKDAFLLDPYTLFMQPSQQQFGERVADAFATMWMMKLGGDMKAVQLLQQQRRGLHPARPHFTDPVFDVIKSNKDRIVSLGRVDAIWETARDIQRQVGVSQEAINAQPGLSGGRASAPKEQKIVRWVVTAQGPVPIDADGNVVPQPTPQHLQPKNFNQLPRFGQ